MIERLTGAPPTCLVLPGFLDPAGDTALHALAECLVSAGMTVVADDPRGTWSSPGHTRRSRSDRPAGRHHAQIDARPAGRVVLVGHCYGAYLAMLAAARDDRVTDVVAIMPTRCFIWPDDYTPARDTWRAAGNKLFLRTAAASGARSPCRTRWSRTPSPTTFPRRWDNCANGFSSSRESTTG